MGASLQYHDDENGRPPEQMPLLEPRRFAETATPFHTGRFHLYTLSIIMVLVFLFDFAGSLVGAPTLRIYESIICHNFYKVADPSRIGDGGWVDERDCKIDAVQEELATLTGWESFFTYLPGG
jgi:hypothetical protein